MANEMHWGPMLPVAEAISTLLEAGANPNIVDEQGHTPLMYAARNGDYDSVKALLDAGANPALGETWQGEDAYSLVMTRATGNAGVMALRYSMEDLAKEGCSNVFDRYRKVMELFDDYPSDKKEEDYSDDDDGHEMSSTNSKRRRV